MISQNSTNVFVYKSFIVKMNPGLNGAVLEMTSMALFADLFFIFLYDHMEEVWKKHSTEFFIDLYPKQTCWFQRNACMGYP